MADHSAPGRRWRWPQGIVNRILLVAWSVLLALYAWSLADLLFLGRRLHFQEPQGYDVAVRGIYLGFGLALFLIPFSRRRYRLLLPAHLVGGLAALLHSTALWLPPPWLGYVPVAWGLLSCAEAALWVAALTHGERWDEFILTAPLVLLATLLGREVDSAWPLGPGDEAGEGGSPAQIPR